jgi:hypothetical protein
MGHQQLMERSTRAILHVEHQRNRLRNVRWVGHGRQLDQTRAVVELVRDLGCDRECEASLAAAAGAGEGHQAARAFQQQVAYARDFRITSDQRRAWCRQVMPCPLGPTPRSRHMHRSHRPTSLLCAARYHFAGCLCAIRRLRLRGRRAVTGTRVRRRSAGVEWGG